MHSSDLNQIGEQLPGGVWLPKGEDHLREWMTTGKRAELVDGQETYQIHKLRAAVAYLPPWRRRLALDIGAHVGLWSMQLCKMFERVVAFEPIPLHVRLFAANVRADNVELKQTALGDRPGFVDFGNDGQSSGGTFVKRLSDHADGMTAPICPLDGLALGAVDFVKIDTEGYELPVCQGGRRLLEVHRPVMVVEQKGRDADHHGGRAREAVAFLTDALGATVLEELSGDVILGWTEVLRREAV